VIVCNKLLTVEIIIKLTHFKIQKITKLNPLKLQIQTEKICTAQTQEIIAQKNI